MSQRSGLLQIPAARIAAFSRAVLAVSLCASLMVLPPLLVANLMLWLLCHHSSGKSCGQLLTLSLTDFGM